MARLLALVFLGTFSFHSLEETISFSISKKQDSSKLPSKKHRKNTNRIHTPASSTGRFHKLTNAERSQLSDLCAAGRKRDWATAQELFVPSSNYKAPLLNAYMTAAMKCEQFLEGTVAYEKLCAFSLPKELVTYNLAIKLYAKSGQGECADQVAQEAMQVFGLDHTLAAARLVAAAELGDFPSARLILQEMQESNVTVDLGHVTTAFRAFTNDKSKTSSDATKLLQEMLDLGLVPDAGLCNSFLSTIEKPELEDFVMLDGIVGRFQVRLHSGYVETYLRKLLLLGLGRRTDADMQKHLHSVPMDRLQSAWQALQRFEVQSKKTSLCQTLQRLLQEFDLPL